MWRDLIIYTPMYVTFFWAVILLLGHKQNNLAKHFLGIFMVAAFLLYFSHALFFKKHLDVYVYFDSLYLMASLSVYPLYFWYIKLLTVEPKIKYQNLWMLSPALLLGIFSVALYLIMLPEERQVFIKHYLLQEKSTELETTTVVIQKWVHVFIRILFAVQIVFFLFFGSKLVFRYNKRIANFYSNLESKTIIWVNLLLFSFVITSVISIVFNIIGKSVFFNNIILLSVPSIIFSVLLFVIGLQGYMQNHTVADLEIDEQQIPELETRKFNRSKLKEDLLELFNSEKVFMQPDLKITHVSEKLKTNRTYLSNLINKEFSCTFSDFVNKYRINEAKRLLNEKSYNGFSQEYISEKSGFGSLSSFIRVFREIENTTPGRFRDQNKL